MALHGITALIQLAAFVYPCKPRGTGYKHERNSECCSSLVPGGIRNLRSKSEISSREGSQGRRQGGGPGGLAMEGCRGGTRGGEPAGRGRG